VAGYADLEEAKRQLKLSDTNPAHAARIADLADLDEAISRLFDRLTGATFDATPGATTRTYEGRPGFAVLVLDVPVKSVAAVEAGGTWDGAAWTGAEAVAADGWRYWQVDKLGRALGLLRLGGVWPAPVRVTGTWADDLGEGVPAPVVSAVTDAVVKETRRRAAAPGGTLNIEELETAAPSFLRDPVWTATVELYAARPSRAVVM
jgi:hypothetical protein